MKHNLPRFVIESLTIEVFVIGYKTIGESILIFIKCDSSIVFSAIIDCYSYNSMNKTDEILSANKVDKLNYLCWSHPDEDHSTGIDIIFKKYVDNSTIINIPENAEINAEECSQKVFQIFNELQSDVNSARKKYNVYTVSDSKDLLCTLDDLNFMYNNTSFTLKMNSIAPNSQLLRKDLLSKNFKPNNHSIAFILTLGNTSLFFTGDIENSTIKSIHPKQIPAQIDFIKIPHHCSSTSDYLLNYFDEAKVACTTSYIRGKSHHPDIALLTQYCQKCKHVYMTSHQNQTINKYDFGVIHITFDVLNDIITPILNGNAVSFCNDCP